MKRCLCVLFAVLLSNDLYALEKSELVGTWRVITEGASEGLAVEGDAIIEYRSNGTYVASGVGYLREEDGNELLVTISGPTAGKWDFRNGKLSTTTTEDDLELFMSNVAGLTKSKLRQVKMRL